MMIDPLQLLHHTIAGGIAATGFGVLFNIGPKTLARCFIAGALALFVRTIAMSFGFGLEVGSFLAALTVGVAAQVLSIRGGIARSSLAVAGTIPMIPGSYAAKAIVALFTLTTPSATLPAEAILEAVQYLIRTVLTFGALGAGVAIPFQILGDKGR